MRRSEDIIERCVGGRTAREVIRAIEEEIPDASSVRSSLMSDIRRSGIIVRSRDVFVEGTCIKISTVSNLTETDREVLRSIADVYSRTYPEFNVLLAL